MRVRNFQISDYPLLLSWWKIYDQGIPTLEMLPVKTTFVIEADNLMLASVTIYLTNSEQFAMIDNLIANPDIDEELRRESIHKLCLFVDSYVSDRGIKSILALSTKEKLTERYQAYGYLPTAFGLTSLIKKLGDSKCPHY